MYGDWTINNSSESKSKSRSKSESERGILEGVLESNLVV